MQQCTYVRFPCQPIRVLEKVRPTRVMNALRGELWELKSKSSQSGFEKKKICQPGLRGGNYRRISRQPGFKKTIQPTMVMSAFRWKLWELKTKPRQSGFKKKIRPNKKSVRGEFSLPRPRGTDRNQLDPKKMFFLLHTLDTH